MTSSTDCEQIRIAAMAAADGEEPPLPREQIDEHMLQCAACREEIERSIARRPLPPNIRRVESTEHVWPLLEPQLQQQVRDDDTGNHLPDRAVV